MARLSNVQGFERRLRREEPRRYNQNDLTRQRFDRLTALHELRDYHPGGVLWECRCACGATVRRLAATLRFLEKRGKAQACPDCIQLDRLATKGGGR